MLRKFQSDLQKINQNNQKSDIGQVSIEAKTGIVFKKMSNQNLARSIEK